MSKKVMKYYVVDASDMPCDVLLKEFDTVAEVEEYIAKQADPYEEISDVEDRFLVFKGENLSISFERRTVAKVTL